jgi:hypothetical protein
MGARQEGNHGQDEKDEKQDFGDSGRRSGDAAEPQNRCDQRDNQEKNRCVEHIGPPFRFPMFKSK